MIDFSLTEEQIAIQKLVRDFVKKEIIPVAKQYDATAEFPWPIVKKAYKIGLWNLAVPEEYGGQGVGSHVTESIVFEELAYGCLGIFGAFGGTSLALTPILLAGTQEQKKKHLCWFTKEPRLAAFALTEPDAGSDVGSVSTAAQRIGNEYIINGRKCFITHGGIADLYVIFANVDKSMGLKGLTAFIVAGNNPGIQSGKKEDKMGDRASHIADVIFEELRVPVEDRLGHEGDGFNIAMSTLDHTRPAIGSAAVGVARRALEEAVAYAKQRVQFKRSIASQQCIQFMLADIAISVETARQIVRKAAWLIDSGSTDPMLSAACKCYASDIAMKAAEDAVQILGGYGYMKDYPVEKLMRDIKITQIYEGTNQILRAVIARELLK